MITEKGLQLEEEKILRNMRIPQTVKQTKKLIGLVQFFRSFLPILVEKLMPFYNLLRKNVEFKINEDHQILRDDLSKATKTTLRLVKPDQQYGLLCDASYHINGFVLMIEDYNQKGKTDTKVKSYAPVSYGSRLSNSGQLKISTYCKRFLALYFALENFSNYIWGCKKPVIILTDNKRLTSFFDATINLEFFGQSANVQYSYCAYTRKG